MNDGGLKMSEKEEIKKRDIESDKTSEFESKVYVITAAQGIQNPASASKYGRDSSKGRPNVPLIKNIEKYVEDNHGELRICAIAGSYVNEIETHSFFHDRSNIYMDEDAFNRLGAQREREEERRTTKEGELLRYPQHYFWHEIPDVDHPKTDRILNSKISLIGLPEPPQNQDPLSGNLDLSQYVEKSIIFPHTKQRFKPVPKNLGGKLPRIVMTTGCCTHPNYNGSNRRGRKAIRDHQYGFAVVETIDNKLYLPRLVPAQKDGTFIDMGIKYSAKTGRISRAKTQALILGDIHCPNQDEKTMQANFEMIDYFKPSELYIHDLFDGVSVSPHTAEDEIEHMFLAESGMNKLEDEVEKCYDLLMGISRHMGKRKVKVIASNHDDFLRRWLTSGSYRKEPHNARFAHKIYSKIQPEQWPLAVAMEIIGKLPNNIEFLTLSDDCRPWGYETAAHGHKGINGARGSLKSLRTGYGKVIMGHTHQLEVNKGSICVGTSGIIPMPYQKGQPSTSIRGSAVIYGGDWLKPFQLYMVTGEGKTIIKWTNNHPKR